MTTGHRRIASLITITVSAAMLTGCVALQIPDESSGGGSTPTPHTAAPTAASSPTPTADASGAPAGWGSFEPCGHEYGVDWVWVDGFPADEMDENALYPQCAEVWLMSLGATETMLTTFVENVSSASINDLGSDLIADGYIETVATFNPDLPPDDGFYGALVYYRGSDTSPDATGIAIEVYGEDEHNDTFQIYVDYFSPETRALDQ
ncbi:hypothetical protein GCM10009860_19120 [Microbacterium mitrae]|uniref:Uncharacterized protein n=1 Tax=Microbacterium mitrae TaxID=664640 RepID=A0A5C8HP21_9MICO|nr:hypothetical protein [Microbacterium mitrae]TXK04561.1 hypothetical protein FVP60_07715 [Microbacterium mitrae]